MPPDRFALRSVPTMHVKSAFAVDRPLRIELIAGSHATEGYEPRQVRKEAAAVTAPVCRGEAQLSVVSARSFRGTSRLFNRKSIQNDNKAARKRQCVHIMEVSF